MRLGSAFMEVNNCNTKKLLDVNNMVELILFVLVQGKAGKRSSEAGRRS
jgi:hypothetical protein